jgi:hypothetical protein
MGHTKTNGFLSFLSDLISSRFVSAACSMACSLVASSITLSKMLEEEESSGGVA